MWETLQNDPGFAKTKEFKTDVQQIDLLKKVLGTRGYLFRHLEMAQE
jgi:hypothetical protein